MCLHISGAIHKKIFRKYIPIKTKKKLRVYKGVRVNWNEKGDVESILSPIYKFPYVIDNMYYTKLSLDYTYYDVTVVVDQGFHSYMTETLVRNSIVCNELGKCNGIAECIIPKGSKIFLSNFGEIVSNRIKIVGVKEL